MTIFTKSAHDVFASVDASGNIRRVVNGEVQTWGREVEYLANLAFTSSLVYSTRAELYANLVPAANTPALVIGDPTSGYDGLYMKVGATTTGSWTRLGDVPGRQYIKATNAGAGTANAIVATTDIPLPSADRGAIISLNIYETNTGTPVTVAFNGGSALTIKTAGGSDVSVGALATGAVVAGYVSGTTFRLFSEGLSLPSAEAYKVLAWNSTATALENRAIDGTGAMIAAVYDAEGKEEQVLTVGDAPDNDDLSANGTSVALRKNVAAAINRPVPRATDVVARVPSQFASMQAVVDYYCAIPRAPGMTVSIHIDTGHAISSGIDVYDGDYSWFVITSDDAEVLLASDFPGTDNIVFGENARMPVLGTVFNGSSLYGSHGYYGRKGSIGTVLPACGIKNLGFTGTGGVQTAGFFFAGNSKLYCAGAISTGNKRNCWISQNSDVHAEDANFSDATGDAAIYLSRRARGELQDVIATGCAGTALLMRRSVAMADDADFSDAGGNAVYIERNSGLSMTNRVTVPKINNAGGSAVRVEGGSTFHFGGGEIKDSGADGVYVSDGGEAALRLATVTGHARYGVNARNGGRLTFNTGYCTGTTSDIATEFGTGGMYIINTVTTSAGVETYTMIVGQFLRDGTGVGLPGTALRSGVNFEVRSASQTRLSLDSTIATDIHLEYAKQGTKYWGQRLDSIVSGTAFVNALVWSDTSGDRHIMTQTGRVGFGTVAPEYGLDVNGTFGFTPGASVTPAQNGDVVFELTNNTTLTVKAKGSDGTVRSGTITLA